MPASRPSASRGLRGFAAGLAGTTLMTASLTAEKWVRRNTRGPVDYDASPHVITAASAVLHWQPRTDAQRRLLFLAVHWGYGSAVGVGYEALRTRLRPVPAAVAFFAGCQAMAFTLFPAVGGTPPPWRWRRSLLLSSLGQHALYAGVVAVTDELARG